MNALEKNLAVARGEALAASLLASAALQTLFMIIPAGDRERILKGISAYIDDTLNLGGPGKGDTNDEPNTQMRETARFMATQHLDGITSMIRNSRGQ